MVRIQYIEKTDGAIKIEATNCNITRIVVFPFDMLNPCLVFDLQNVYDFSLIISQLPYFNFFIQTARGK